MASGAVTGFSAYTLLDPAILGNVGQNISVDSAAVTNLFSKAAHLAVTYDPSVFSVSPSDITLGSIPGLGAGWQITSAVDAATGQIGITLFNLSGTPITATQAGSLVNIAFQVVPGTAVGGTSVQLVSQVTANGQRFVTEVDDDKGPLTLSPGVDRVEVAVGWRRRARVR